MEGRRWVSCAFCGQWIERDGPNGARRRGNAGWCAGCQRWWPDKHAQAVARARAEGAEQDLAARASKRARNSSALDSQGATDEHRSGEQPGGGGQSGADNMPAGLSGGVGDALDGWNGGGDVSDMDGVSLGHGDGQAGGDGAFQGGGGDSGPSGSDDDADYSNASAGPEGSPDAQLNEVEEPWWQAEGLSDASGDDETAGADTADTAMCPDGTLAADVNPDGAGAAVHRLPPVPQRPDDVYVPRTGHWQNAGHHLLHPYTEVTLLEYCFCMFSLKIRHKQTDVAFADALVGAMLAGPKDMQSQEVPKPVVGNFPTKLKQVTHVLGLHVLCHLSLLRDACCGRVTPGSKGRRVPFAGCRLFPCERGHNDCCPGCGMSRYVFGDMHKPVNQRRLANPLAYVNPAETVIAGLLANEKLDSERHAFERNTDVWAGQYLKEVDALLQGGLLRRTPAGNWAHAVFSVRHAVPQGAVPTRRDPPHSSTCR